MWKTKRNLRNFLKYIIVLFMFSWWALLSSAQDTIPLNSAHSFSAIYQPGYSYSWWYTDSNGVRTDFTSTTNITEEVMWNTKGDYNLFTQAKDENNCLSEIITKPFVVTERKYPAPFAVYAGPDTIIGNCTPYLFGAVIPADNSYIYSWSPATYLSNPGIPNPVFTPGVTTTYVLSVTSAEGINVKDTVTITVSEISANAGGDIFMLPNTTAILNGSASTGSNLEYNWSTVNGKIESGANTANPVVSGFGAYYLEVTDEYGCSDSDSVNVTMLTQAPVAVDDYDTTAYQRETIIDVLANDSDPQNSINPSSLSISNPPFNGTAYIDYDAHLVHYRPNNGFTGNDIFEYRICNTFNQCNEAKVTVLVTDFEFLIPNAFSPNGDGINDYFEILGIEYYENNSITIVNRWGNKVYEAKGYGVNTSPVFWDGKSNTGGRNSDENLPTGTYYYVLDLGNGEKPISGSIYLDR